MEVFDMFSPVQVAQFDEYSIFFFNILSSTQYSKAQEFKTQSSNKTKFELALMVDIQSFA